MMHHLSRVRKLESVFSVKKMDSGNYIDSLTGKKDHQSFVVVDDVLYEFYAERVEEKLKDWIVKFQLTSLTGKELLVDQSKLMVTIFELFCQFITIAKPKTFYIVSTLQSNFCEIVTDIFSSLVRSFDGYVTHQDTNLENNTVMYTMNQV